jgi:hypothetical protein
MAFYYGGNFILPGNEFYRFIDLHITFRSQERDEDLHPVPGRVCVNRYYITGYRKIYLIVNYEGSNISV